MRLVPAFPLRFTHSRTSGQAQDERTVWDSFRVPSGSWGAGILDSSLRFGMTGVGRGDDGCGVVWRRVGTRPTPTVGRWRPLTGLRANGGAKIVSVGWFRVPSGSWGAGILDSSLRFGMTGVGRGDDGCGVVWRRVGTRPTPTVGRWRPSTGIRANGWGQASLPPVRSPLLTP